MFLYREIDIKLCQNYTEKRATRSFFRQFWIVFALQTFKVLGMPMSNIKSSELFTQHLRHRNYKSVKMFPGWLVFLPHFLLVKSRHSVMKRKVYHKIFWKIFALLTFAKL